MPEPSTKPCSDIVILGQEINYPKGIHGLLSVIAICFVASYFIYGIAFGNKENIDKALQILTLVIPLNEDVKSGKPLTASTGATSDYQIQFWTPSAKTNDPSDPHLVDSERLTDEKKLIEFGRLLGLDNNVRGYRRYDVAGEGAIRVFSDTPPKRHFLLGEWWVVTVSKSYDIENLVVLYKQYWPDLPSVYVEILRNTGGNYSELRR